MVDPEKILAANNNISFMGREDGDTAISGFHVESSRFSSRRCRRDLESKRDKRYERE